MDNDKQMMKVETHAKVLDMIGTLKLPETEKQELVKKLMSDDLELRRAASEKLAASGVAQHDISNFLTELERINKKGMYATTKLQAKTGSGSIEMQFKGGDTKLIIPVLVIVGIVVIAALVIIFWR